MFRAKQNITVLILWAVAALSGGPPVAASDPPGVMEGPLLAQISPDSVPRKVRPARPDLPPIPPQRDAPRFSCKVNVSAYDPLDMGTESSETFSFTFNWGNVSGVVADEVEVIIRFWYWDPLFQSWNLYSDNYESPVISYDYTNVGTKPGYIGRSLSTEIRLEKDFHGRCYGLDGEPHWARCKYRVTQEVRYRMAPILGRRATNDWITGAECDKVIEWEYTDWEEEDNTRFVVFMKYTGGDYRDFVLSNADSQICRNACVSDVRCEYWTYVRPNHGQGPQAHCWLKERPKDDYRYPVPDNCCISGKREWAR